MKRLLLLLPLPILLLACPKSPAPETPPSTPPASTTAPASAEAPASAAPASAEAPASAAAAPAAKAHPGPCEVITTCNDAEACRGTSHAGGRATHTWSPEGKLLKIEEDFGQDGVIDVREESTWSADGLQVTRVRTYLTAWSDAGYKPAASPARNTTVERFDAQGRLVRVETDSDNDGKAEHAITKRYDDQGRMIEEEMDDGADGTVEHRVKHNLDANGEYELWASHDYPDSDEACFTHPKVTRDAQKRIVREEFNANICDADEVRAHTYDDAGNLTQTTVDLGKDGSVEVTMAFSYGCFK